eukprot:Plantae.Rhodophyta-Hildenbrandia_rubra.ctg41434.p1 GENE.Plantae.Rhodophyta-Hildenbrandia_rubra.ctg41434~~Plantae.Rhodophyta-Hildenbrandia_rubra.ctg41434.p1  ORF type:complete len:274 (-),score=68.30 Plantae.Rhodophyta-Hildenbrandia_rubra.ctg41434:767-1588(-)
MTSVGSCDGFVSMSDCTTTPDLLRRCVGDDGKTPSWANGMPMLTDLVRGFAENGSASASGGHGWRGGGNTEGGLMAQMMENHERAVRAEMWAASSGGNGTGGMDGMWVLGLHDDEDGQSHNTDEDDGNVEEKKCMDMSEVSSESNDRGDDERDTICSPNFTVKKEESVLVNIHTAESKAVVQKESGKLRSSGTIKSAGVKKRKKLTVPFECPALQAKKNRAAAIKRLRQKKLLRTFNTKVRYQCRKKIALHRPRVRGRFATKEEVEKASKAKD